MSARGSRSEVSFAAALQDDLSIFLPGIMPAGEVIERTDGSRLSVHYLGEVPPGEVFKTRRGNTIARAGHGRVVLLGGLHEIDATCFAEEAAAAGPSIAESLPGAIWSDVPRQLEHAKQFLAEARRAQAAAAAESSPEAQRSGGGPALVEHARALRLYEAAHMLSPRPGHLHAARVDKLGPGLGIGVATCTRRRWRCRPCHGPAGLLAPRRPSVGAPLLGHAAGSRCWVTPLHAPARPAPPLHTAPPPRPLHALHARAVRRLHLAEMRSRLGHVEVATRCNPSPHAHPHPHPHPSPHPHPHPHPNPSPHPHPHPNPSPSPHPHPNLTPTSPSP